MFQTPVKTRQSKRLRADSTDAEAKLWSMLRNRQFEGLKFRRQTPLAGAIVDFFCPELKLVIELDGGIHALKEAEDSIRDQRLEQAGFRVLRFSNAAFLNNPNILLDAIRQSNCPSPLGGEGGSRSETDEGAVQATTLASPSDPTNPLIRAAPPPTFSPEGRRNLKA